jgi:hypothetical protein
MDQKIISLIVIISCCCISLSIIGGVGGFFLTQPSATTTTVPTVSESTTVPYDTVSEPTVSESTTVPYGSGATTAFGSLSSFKSGINNDYPDNDIKNFDNIDNNEDCAKQCIDEPKCNLFVRPTTGKGCWLKTKAENGNASTDRVTFVKKGYTL